MLKKYSIFIILLIFTSMSSCELSKINDVHFEVNPEFIIPITYGTIETKQFLAYLGDKDSIISTDSLGDIVIYVREDNLFTLKADEVLALDEDIKLGNWEMKIGTVPTTTTTQDTITLKVTNSMIYF